MIRIGVILVLFAIGRAQAEPRPSPALDQDRLTSVYSDALAFMAPRILEPVPIPRLTVWGLQSLTALDPNLRVVVSDASLRLLRQNEIVAEVTAPNDDAAAAWANAAATLTAASFPVSAPARRAGTQGIIHGIL